MSGCGLQRSAPAAAVSGGHHGRSRCVLCAVAASLLSARTLPLARGAVARLLLLLLAQRGAQLARLLGWLRARVAGGQAGVTRRARARAHMRARAASAPRPASATRCQPACVGGGGRVLVGGKAALAIVARVGRACALCRLGVGGGDCVERCTRASGLCVLAMAPRGGAPARRAAASARARAEGAAALRVCVLLVPQRAARRSLAALSARLPRVPACVHVRACRGAAARGGRACCVRWQLCARA